MYVVLLSALLLAQDQESTADLLARASDAFRHGDFKSTLEWADRAVQNAPDDAGVHLRRGMWRFQAGDIDGSLADFDRVAVLDPDNEPHLWQRGISQYYAGLYREGREQFERHRIVNGNDVENSAWHLLCAARELGFEEAERRFIKIPRRADGTFPDRRVPMEQIYALFAGNGDSESVLKAAGTDRGALCYAHLYLGLYAEAQGEAKRAREHLEKAATDYATPHYMGIVAQIHFRRLHPGVRFANAPKELSKDAQTEDAPGFLGPRRDSTSRETKLLRTWPEEGPSIVWEFASGESYAPPIASGGRTYYVHRWGNEVLLECLEIETGAHRWTFTFETDYQSEYIKGNGPRSAPLLVDDRVFLHGPEGRFFCLDADDGTKLWDRDLLAEFDGILGFFGVVSTPIAHDDLLIVNIGGRGGPCVIAIDQASGSTIWEAGDKWAMSCASPVLATVDGATKAVVFAGGKTRPAVGGIVVVDVASGEVEAEFPWRSRTYLSVNATTPVVVGSRIFVSASYSTGSVALDLEGDEGLGVAWEDEDTGLQFVNAVHRDGHIYAFDSSGRVDRGLMCIDLATGEKKWHEELPIPEKRRMGEASLLAFDDFLLGLGEKGDLVSLEVTPSGPKLLDHAILFDAPESWSPPVVHRGLLLIGQNAPEQGDGAGRRLICYDLRER